MEDAEVDGSLQPSDPPPGPPLVSMLLRRGGLGEWRSPEMSHFKNEGAMQTLLAGSDEYEGALQALLASSSELFGKNEKRAVVTELTVPGIGSLDICAVGPSGTITLVECKLHRNPEIRRTVVGQLFAYAAGLTGLTYEEFDGVWATNKAAALVASVPLAAGVVPGWDEEGFRRTVSENLRTGRFDLVFAVDSITDELKKVVRYLNEHTVSEIRVLALELGYARDGDVEVLVPAVYGEETAASKQSRPGVGYEQLIAQASEVVQQAAKRLSDWADREGLDSTDFASSRRWSLRGGTSIVSFYPRLGYADVPTGGLRRAGLDPEANDLVTSLRMLNPQAKGKGVNPTVRCSDVVNRWTEVERVLTQVLELRRSLSGRVIPAVPGI
jgi:hypothetical protein